MLDKKTRAVLAYLETQCPGGSFKVLEKQDIVAAMPTRLALTAEEIDCIVAYLDRSEFVVLKYLDEQQMCLTLTPKAHSALLDEKRLLDKPAFDKKVYWIVGIIAFVAAFLGAIIGNIVGL